MSENVIDINRKKNLDISNLVSFTNDFINLAVGHGFTTDEIRKLRKSLDNPEFMGKFIDVFMLFSNETIKEFQPDILHEELELREELKKCSIQLKSCKELLYERGIASEEDADVLMGLSNECTRLVTLWKVMDKVREEL